MAVQFATGRGGAVADFLFTMAKSDYDYIPFMGKCQWLSEYQSPPVTARPCARPGLRLCCRTFQHP